MMITDYEFDVSTAGLKVESNEKIVGCGVEFVNDGSTGASSDGIDCTEELEKKVEIRVSDDLQLSDTTSAPDRGEVEPEVRVSDNLQLSGTNSAPDGGEVEPEVRVSDNLQLSGTNSANDGGEVESEVRVSLEIDSREMNDNLEFRLSEVELEEDRKIASEQLIMKEERVGVYFGERKGNIEEETGKGTVLDFSSAYSRVDESTRMSGEFGSEAAKGFKYGFEPGDMVWGKVKSHPWWPGQIFKGSLASSSVRHTKREGHLLVAFFGDNSYGWFDPAELIPFEPHYAEKSQQANSRTFMKAVEDAVDEAQRRAALGLTCYCRNPFNFRSTNVQGYFAVDVGGYEPGFLYSVRQIKKARDSFHPVEALSFLHQLAMEPQNNDQTGIDYMKNVALFVAYRTATFEEFDETYSQAFGTHPTSSSSDSKGVLDQPTKFTSQDPSGPLVFAESMGGVKSITKFPKDKDQAKKDKYLLKRRDSMDEPNAPHFSQAHASSSSGYKEVAGAAGDFVQRTPAASIFNKHQASAEQEGIQTISQEDAGLISGEPKFNMVGAQGNMKRFDLPDGSPMLPGTCSSTSSIQRDPEEGKIPGMNARVTTAGDIDSASTCLDGSIILEKLEPSGIMDSIHPNLHHESKVLVDLKQEENAKFSSLSDGLASPVKDCRGVDQVWEGGGSRDFLKSVSTLPLPVGLKVPDKVLMSDAAAKLKKVKILKRPRSLISDKTSTGEVKKKKKKPVGLEAFLNQTPGKFQGIGMAPGEKSQVVPQRKSNGISSTTITGSAVPLPKVDLGNINLELPQILSDLLTLALDPFHGVERNGPTIVRHVLLQFRSLVYQKSLIMIPVTGPKTSELGNRKSSVIVRTTGVSSGDNPMPRKLLKPMARPDDPTISGRKRSASDLQEEMSAKKAKKVKVLKSLTTEKKAGNQKKILELKLGEQKEAAAPAPTKLAPAPTKPAPAQSKLVTAPTKLTKAEILKKQRDRKEVGFAVPLKPSKPDTVKREPPVRVSEPTMLVMMFPPRTTLPSVPELKAKFARFGPLDPSAFRIFWKSSTCRVVFKYKSHAQTAYRFAVQNRGFFGQLKVNYQLKDVSVAASEISESAKQRQDDHGSDDFQTFRTGLGSDSLGGEPRRSLQPASQLKSCLKKSAGEETSEAVRENPRVKFILDGEASSRSEQSMSMSMSMVNTSSIGRNQSKNTSIGSSSEPVVCGSPSSTHAMDLNSKKFQKLIPPPPLPPVLAHPVPHNLDMHENHGMGHFSNATIHPSCTQVAEEQKSISKYTNMIISSFNTNSIDFSTKFLNLLMRCNDIVSDVRSSLGHIPYQPL